jgi:uncharacterized membrane protein (DUF2068 family)
MVIYGLEQLKVCTGLMDLNLFTSLTAAVCQKILLPLSIKTIQEDYGWAI